MKQLIIIIGAIFVLSACSAEPGSEKWCAKMKETPKSEWTASDAGTYTKNCLIEGTETDSEE